MIMKKLLIFSILAFSFVKVNAQQVRLLQAVKAHYGDNHPVLCVAPKHGSDHHDYIRRVVESCGMPAVYYAGLPAEVHDNDADLGASWHPNYNGHRKIASVVAPFISSIMGWELPVWFNE